MTYKQIKDKIQSIWKTMNNLKSMDAVQQIADSQKKVNTILGKNVIQNITHTSLLKFIINELIIFAGQKCRTDQHEMTLHQTSLRLQQRLVKSMGRIKQIKSLLNDIGKSKKEINSQIIMDVYDFKSLTRKLNILEEDLLEEGHIDRGEVINPVDAEGMEVMIEQLESLLKNKQSRIKQLNEELEDSAYDKDQLEQEIQELTFKNTSLNEKNNKLTLELAKIRSQYQRYKTQQKEKVSERGIDMMNSQFLANKVETNISETTLNQQNLEQFDWNGLSAQYHNNFFERCSSPSVSKNTVIQQTIKKPISNFTTKDEQNILDPISLIKQISFKNDDNFLDRLLLMQALAIQHNLEDIIN